MGVAIAPLPCANCLRRIISRPPTHIRQLSHMSKSRLSTVRRLVPVVSTSSRIPLLAQSFHASSNQLSSSNLSKNDDRPRSTESTQTDFNELNVFSNIPPPASSIESCMQDGFVLANGVTVQDAGML